MPTAVVLGASGFSGGELLRLLARHPDLAVVAASAAAGVGAPVAAVHPHLAALDGVLVSVQEACSVRADVLFSCLPHGELARHIEGIEAPLVVDLADDFRADQGWVYGLTEFVRPSLAGARRVANPGCYPTATLLAVVPFAREKLVSGPVVVDAISGTSGAGRKPSEKLSLAAAEASVTSYGSVSHRHVAEIERGLCAFGGLDAPISFTPHLAPMSRGLLATVRARLDAPLSDDAATEVLRAAYAGEDFV